jgi:hypothetical protein
MSLVSAMTRHRQRSQGQAATIACNESQPDAEEQPASSKAMVIMPWRLAAELLAVFGLLSWALALYSFNPHRCDFVHARSGTRSLVTLLTHTGWAWNVDDDGLVTTAHPEDAPLGFSMEWQGERFCLRWIATMQVIEFSPKDLVLRLGKYECDERGQLFEQRSKSMWNVGAQSYVNIREGL